MGLPRDEVELVAQVALLHDIGKIGMLDSILNKPSNLSDAERELVKSHPVVGAQILAPVKTFERHVAGIRYHHEMFDGSGYPDGLKGNDIPVAARIVSLADAFDAMTSTRPYRIGLPLSFAIQEMTKMRGKQFCPVAVDAFARVLQSAAAAEAIAPAAAAPSPEPPATPTLVPAPGPASAGRRPEPEEDRPAETKRTAA
jgi:HD-GYP domain-containing protein (c-di-GMP phosphodiesterase class II)